MTGPIHNRLHASIYAEHLEEAALLHQHRRLWLEDPSLTLHDLVELEEREEAHLDGLVVGAPHTLGLCARALAEGDAAELHVGVRIACRCGDVGVLEALARRLTELDEEDRTDFEQSASAALSIELPKQWAPLLGETLTHSNCGPVVAEAIGRRRIAAGPLLLRHVLERDCEVDPRYVRALGQLRDPTALSCLRALLGRATAPKLWSEVAIACLQLGDREVAALLAGSARASAWSPIGQAIVCDVPSAWLCEQLASKPTPDLLIALALRGDPGSLAACVTHLADDGLGDAAAGALLAITGAPPFDAAGQDEGDDQDFEAGPTPCRDPERWTAWLDAHARAWSPGARYRLGQPCTAANTLEALASFALPLELRQALRDEFAIRHGALPPHVTAPAREQLSWFADRR